MVAAPVLPTLLLLLGAIGLLNEPLAVQLALWTGVVQLFGWGIEVGRRRGRAWLATLLAGLINGAFGLVIIVLEGAAASLAARRSPWRLLLAGRSVRFPAPGPATRSVSRYRALLLTAASTPNPSATEPPCSRVAMRSHCDDNLPPGAAVDHVLDGRGGFAQRVGPVDDRGDLAGLDELLEDDEVLRVLRVDERASSGR